MITMVLGEGYNDRKYPTRENGKARKVYITWLNMMKRCYDKQYVDRQPTYAKCKASDNFKSYSYFHDWYKDQIGSNISGFALDKDLLVRGNKIYSEDTCVFLPREVNNFLEKRESLRGDCLIGVFLDKRSNEYCAQIRISGRQVNLGSFDSEISAFNAYKKLKEAHAKDLAEKYKSEIDIRAYNALIDFEVNILD